MSDYINEIIKTNPDYIDDLLYMNEYHRDMLEKQSISSLNHDAKAEKELMTGRKYG